MLSILYEDNYLIVVDKPHGIQVEKNPQGYPNLEDQVSDYLSSNYPWKKQWSAGVVHRLDRPVGGVVVFAKTRMALKSLNRQFEERTVRKTYRAWVENTPPAGSGQLEHYLVKDPVQKKSVVSDKDHSKARRCLLRYHVLSCGQSTCLLEIELLTGRYHQIRAQLSAAGCPVIGDVKYGSAIPLAGTRILLKSWSIELAHPKSGEQISFLAKDDAEWEEYEM